MDNKKKPQQQQSSLGSSLSRVYIPPVPGSVEEREWSSGSFSARPLLPAATSSTLHLKVQSPGSPANPTDSIANQEGIQSQEYETAPPQIDPRSAIRDELTDAFIFPYIVDRLSYEVMRAQLVGGPLSVVAISISGYSQIGITYGALALDLSIQELTKAVRSVVRQLDLIGVYTEGKLLIVCPHTDSSLARALCERLVPFHRDFDWFNP